MRYHSNVIPADISQYIIPEHSFEKAEVLQSGILPFRMVDKAVADTCVSPYAPRDVTSD